MSFLSGLGRGLQGLFDGNRLAIAQALASGDYQGAAVLRARMDELQRQREQRDAQVIGAKNMGLSNDEIGAMSTEDLSRLAQAHAYARMFDPGWNGAADVKRDGSAAGAEEPKPKAKRAVWQFAPSPGRPPGGLFVQTSGPFGGGPPFSDAGPAGNPAFGAPRLGALPPLANIPRAQNYAEANALSKGSYFFAPNGSLRQIV